MAGAFANRHEEQAWRETWCRRCYQPEEATARITLSGAGCQLPIIAQHRVPTQWTRRRNPIMGDTYKCSDFLDKPAVDRRGVTEDQTESMFDL